MIDSQSDCGEAGASEARSSWVERGILAAVCALVVAVYAYTAHSGSSLPPTPDPADDYYNLLVQGFRTGQLNLKVDVPRGLAQLTDPYDPAAHFPYPVLDLSYYKGKLHLYFGVTPALTVFWPYVALTGRYLPDADAAMIFCVVGFLVGAGLLCALWRRYFAGVNLAVVAAGALALGFATCAPFLLAACKVYEVAISCGYAFTMLALAAIWMALHKCRKRSVWLAAAGLAYGLAVGARPNLLFGAVILLVPVAQTWREQRKFWAPLLAATAPIVVIGLGLMLYNYLRFDSPFEFGLRYQLSGEQHFTQRFFSLGYLWFNFRVYFLAAAHWGGRFPFVHDITMPPLPAGHGGVDRPFGVLTNMPLVWLALAVPLGWRGRSAQARSAFCGFSTVLAALFGIAALMLGLYYTVACRYDLDFLPAFVLLAVTGILSVERTLVARPVWQRAARWGWSLLLGFSVVFGLLVSVARCAEHYRDLGAVFFQQGRLQEAVSHYQRALQIEPDYATAHNELGMALVRLGRLTEAIGHYEQALRIRPDFAEADNNLANALAWSDRLPEAVGHYERALRIKPDFAEAHNNLGVVLTRLGRRQEAIGHLEQALRIRPDYADARHNLEQAQAAQ